MVSIDTTKALREEELFFVFNRFSDDQHVVRKICLQMHYSQLLKLNLLRILPRTIEWHLSSCPSFGRSSAGVVKTSNMYIPKSKSLFEYVFVGTLLDPIFFSLHQNTRLYIE